MSTAKMWREQSTGVLWLGFWLWRTTATPTVLDSWMMAAWLKGPLPSQRQTQLTYRHNVRQQRRQATGWMTKMRSNQPFLINWITLDHTTNFSTDFRNSLCKVLRKNLLLLNVWIWCIWPSATHRQLPIPTNRVGKVNAWYKTKQNNEKKPTIFIVRRTVF